jgi:hypothetical protein
MKYILDKEYLEVNGGETVQFSRFSKVRGTHHINLSTYKSVSKNQDLLEELYKLKKPYVKIDSSKTNKNKKVNGYNKTTSKQKEKQVLPKASEE